MLASGKVISELQITNWHFVESSDVICQNCGAIANADITVISKSPTTSTLTETKLSLCSNCLDIMEDTVGIEAVDISNCTRLNEEA